MSIKLRTLLVSIAGLSCSLLPIQANAAGRKKSKIVFEDNFNQKDKTPDRTKWELCRNRPPAWSCYLSENYDQAYVEDGKLILKAEKTNGTYKTGGIQTKGHFNFTYGKAEVSARFISAKGGWPAIWLLPEDRTGEWPACGEIDIMEQLNHDNIVYQTIHNHYKNKLGFNTPVPSKTAPFKVGKFNTYGLEWTPDSLIFSVNGKRTFAYPNLHLPDEATKMQWPFNKPFYLILNCALGGPDTWPGEINDSELPAIMEVDWVKISQQ